MLCYLIDEILWKRQFLCISNGGYYGTQPTDEILIKFKIWLNTYVYLFLCISLKVIEISALEIVLVTIF